MDRDKSNSGSPDGLEEMKLRAQRSAASAHTQLLQAGMQAHLGATQYGSEQPPIKPTASKDRSGNGIGPQKPSGTRTEKLALRCHCQPSRDVFGRSGAKSYYFRSTSD